MINVIDEGTLDSATIDGVKYFTDGHSFYTDGPEGFVIVDPMSEPSMLAWEAAAYPPPPWA